MSLPTTEQIQVLAHRRHPDLSILTLEPVPTLLVHLLGVQQCWQIFWVRERDGASLSQRVRLAQSVLTWEPLALMRDEHSGEEEPPLLKDALRCSLIARHARVEVTWGRQSAHLTINGLASGFMDQAQALLSLQILTLLPHPAWRIGPLARQTRQMRAWLTHLMQGPIAQARYEAPDCAHSLILAPAPWETLALWMPGVRGAAFSMQELTTLLETMGVPWERGWTTIEDPDHPTNTTHTAPLLIKGDHA